MSKEISEDDIQRIVKTAIVGTEGISQEQTIMSKEISEDDIRRIGKSVVSKIHRSAFAGSSPSTSSPNFISAPDVDRDNLSYDPVTGTFKLKGEKHNDFESIADELKKEIQKLRDEQRSLVDEYHRQKRLLFILTFLLIPCLAILLIMMFTAK